MFVNVAGGMRIEEPGADLAVALAIASAARGAPALESAAAFGEIGLTGRLRPAAQAERRIDECAKLGIDDGHRARGHACRETDRGSRLRRRCARCSQARACGARLASTDRLADGRCHSVKPVLKNRYHEPVAGRELTAGAFS